MSRPKSAHSSAAALRSRWVLRGDGADWVATGGERSLSSKKQVAAPKTPDLKDPMSQEEVGGRSGAGWVHVGVVVVVVLGVTHICMQIDKMNKSVERRVKHHDEIEKVCLPGLHALPSHSLCMWC